jgi:hypothetical protein
MRDVSMMLAAAAFTTFMALRPTMPHRPPKRLNILRSQIGPSVLDPCATRIERLARTTEFR